MSEASERGRNFELRIARLLRRYGVKAYRNTRSGAGAVYKADIDSPGFRFSLEAKDQKTIKLREWWGQAVSATPSYKLPMLVVATDEYTMLSIVRTEDIMSLIQQNQEDSETIKQLRSKDNESSR
jgi:hypothetical protein